MASIGETLKRLEGSKFRSSFHLSKKDKAYVKEKGMDVIRAHAYDLIEKKIGLKYENDGRQTPMHGHPVFKAMHATATCCRGCLNKWYRVKEDTELSVEQKKKIVELVMAWIVKEMDPGIKNSMVQKHVTVRE